MLPRRTTFGGRGAAQDLRDDLAGARDFHKVTRQDVFRRDELEVVERGGGYCDTADFHRLEHRIGIERPGAPDVNPDLLELRDPHLGRELAGHGPARLAVSDCPELGVLPERVHLHDDAVRAVVELGQQCLELRHFRMRVRQVGHQRVVRLHRKAPRGQALEQRMLCLHRQLLTGCLDVEAEDAETAAARDLGIELAQRSGGGVARIGERGLAGLLALPVELGEPGLGEVDLPADLHQFGPALSLEPQRDLADGAQIGGDVLALDAVAARRPDREHAIAVREAHRRAVDFHLERIARRPDLGHEPPVPVLPLGELCFGERVGERQHGHEVAMLTELVGRLGAHAVGGAVGRPQLRVLGLELLQLAEQPVVLGVRDLRLVEYVAGVVGALEESP